MTNQPNEYIITLQNKFIKKINNIDTISKSIGVFDLEFWEHDHYKILEIGWVIYQDGIIKPRHLIIRDNLKLHNNRYVKSNKFSRNDSETVNLQQALKIFKKDFLSSVDIIMGHGLENDIKILKFFGIDVTPTVDIGEYGYFIYNKKHKVSLKNLLNKLKIDFSKNLHNATDDAELILEVFLKLQQKFRKK